MVWWCATRVVHCTGYASVASASHRLGNINLSPENVCTIVGKEKENATGFPVRFNEIDSAKVQSVDV